MSETQDNLAQEMLIQDTVHTAVNALAALDQLSPEDLKRAYAYARTIDPQDNSGVAFAADSVADLVTDRFDRKKTTELYASGLRRDAVEIELFKEKSALRALGARLVSRVGQAPPQPRSS